MSRMVDTSVWQNMDGLDDNERKINAYISGYFIGKIAPSNECLQEAVNVIEFSRQIDALDMISEYLSKQFMPSSIIGRNCDKQAKKILELLGKNV